MFIFHIENLRWIIPQFYEEMAWSCSLNLQQHPSSTPQWNFQFVCFLCQWLWDWYETQMHIFEETTQIVDSGHGLTEGLGLGSIDLLINWTIKERHVTRETTELCPLPSYHNIVIHDSTIMRQAKWLLTLIPCNLAHNRDTGCMCSHHNLMTAGLEA